MERLNKAQWPFIGGSYLARSRTFDCSRTVNLYPELSDQGGGKNLEVAALYSTPGLRKVQELGLGPIRGSYTASQSNVCYIVSGNELYQLSAAEGSPTLVTGNLNTSIGPVSMTDNGQHLLIVDGSNGYTVDFSAPAVSVISDPNFYNGARTCTYQGGYFILDVPNSSNFFISDPDSIDFPPLNESSALSSPDDVVGVISNNEQLYVLGRRTIETWTLTGQSASAPFSLSPGQVINIGVTAIATVRKLAATFFWLGGNDQGEGVVYSMENNSPTRVSNHAIEYRIQQLGDLSTATAFSYQRDGHYFYALNLPGSDTTWVYDMSTKQWHERQSIVSGVIGRHLGETSAFLSGEHLIGDYRNGNVYVYDYEYYKDNGEPLRRLRQTPHLSQGVAMCFYKTLQVDIQPGVGIIETTPADVTLYDTFTGTSTLVAHTPETGGAWAMFNSADPLTAQVNGVLRRPTEVEQPGYGYGSSYFTNPVTWPTGDFDITFTARFTSDNHGEFEIGRNGSSMTNSDKFFSLQQYGTNNATIYLGEALAASANYTGFALDTDYDCKVTVRGATLAFLVNGTQVLTTTLSSRAWLTGNPAFVLYDQAGVAMIWLDNLKISSGETTSTSINPRLVLRISRDGGFNFGNPIYGAMGYVGNYLARARWLRLGRGRDLVMQVFCDDPTNVVFLSAWLDVEVGTA